jgi:hypothetical protein
MCRFEKPGHQVSDGESVKLKEASRNRCKGAQDTIGHLADAISDGMMFLCDAPIQLLCWQ